MPPEKQSAIVADRLTSLYREVGTLLPAFTPLDYSMQPDLAAWSLAGFITVGGRLFALSVHRELRGVR